MNYISKAYYRAAKDFSRMHPDMFVFVERDLETQSRLVVIEYNGGFCEAKNGKLLFCPRIEYRISDDILSSIYASDRMVALIRSRMEQLYDEILNNYTFIKKGDR